MVRVSRRDLLSSSFLAQLRAAYISMPDMGVSSRPHNSRTTQTRTKQPPQKGPTIYRSSRRELQATLGEDAGIVRLLPPSLQVYHRGLITLAADTSNLPQNDIGCFLFRPYATHLLRDLLPRASTHVP